MYNLKGVEHIKFWIPALLIAGTAGIPLGEGIAAIIEWLTETQEEIEGKLYGMRYGDNKAPEIYLYDVTSSYLEVTSGDAFVSGSEGIEG